MARGRTPDESMREWRSCYLQGISIRHEVFETLQAGSSLQKLTRVTERQSEASASRA
ncbi:MAG: hypothetical protein ABSB67_13870 [Bryobacteraceae bacterium]|jgi:hypothetical protein